MGTSGRSTSDPFGYEDDHVYVRVANRIVARTGLLLLLALARMVAFEVEQPASTKLFMMPYMMFIEDLCKALKIRFHNSFLPLTQHVVWELCLPCI